MVDGLQKAPDEKFYSGDCNKPKDYILTNGGPIITFKSDNLVWEFKGS